ncbi:V-type proton ATPase subunit C-like [Triticum aestivum]|uniref:V-type proton ATPase subunit C-like n=1 Tax=Triticum aestivum TaxID=4565 RepID=UPI001D005600|nr:V-type proton ATPase subunit C-like [Triticum aestivum]
MAFSWLSALRLAMGAVLLTAASIALFTLPIEKVPRSSKKLYEDNEYALYTVTLFAKVVDNFKVHSHEKGFQIRDFEYSPKAQESRKQELEKLLQDQEVMRTSLLQWCYASYSECYS